jgi:hypothetical protein
VKRLEKKPIWAFKDSAQFLQIVKAEKEGYITATISIPNEADFLQEMEQLYLSDGTPPTTPLLPPQTALARGVADMSPAQSAHDQRPTTRAQATASTHRSGTSRGAWCSRRP